MRLTCPNCDAQYEVPDEVMPISGRDVQCSNCGQTWFQHHPDHAPEEEEMIEAAQAPDPDEEVAPAPPPPPPPSKEPRQRELDPAVADILRQEAEAEFEARQRRQSETLESQPELGLETAEERAPLTRDTDPDNHDAERRAAEARKRMARMRGEPDPGPDAAAAAISSRRELLPDIEEINSTLRSDDTPSGVDADAREELGAGGEQKQKRSFRTGFRTVVLIAIVLALLYVFAPRITAAVPALEGVMGAFVGAIDQARVSLDGLLSNLLGWLNDAASESGNEGN